MAKEFAKSFYNSSAWRATRQAYIKHRIGIDGGMCETCHTRPGIIVHHKQMITKENIGNTEVTLSLDNLKLECKVCHDCEEGHFIKKKETRCTFDSNGQMIPKK